jgi:hypothetical protein
VLCVAGLPVCRLAFGTFDEPGKLLFLDSFEALKTQDGVGSTQPATYSRGAGPIGGERSFWVKLNFDPNAKNEKTRTVLRNPIFLTLVAPNGNRPMFYTCLENVSFAVTRHAQISGGEVAAEGRMTISPPTQD